MTTPALTTPRSLAPHADNRTITDTVNQIIRNVGQFGSTTQFYETRTAATAASIPSSINAIYVSGYTAIGDGGQGLYKRVGSAPTNNETFQSADGAYWQGYHLFQQINTKNDDSYFFRIERVATHTGGTAGVVSTAARVYSSAPSGATNYEWAFLSVLDNAATAGENVAIYGQANLNSTGPTWAGVLEARDKSGTSDPANTLTALELDVFANGTDVNKQRLGLSVIIGRHNTSGSVCETGCGVRVYASSTSNGRVKKGMSVECEYDVAFDASAGTQASGGFAFKMKEGQAMAMDDTAARRWFYSSGSIVFQLSGVTKAAIDISSGASSGTYSIQGNAIIGPRSTGWTAMTNTADKATSYDTTTITLPQLAARVKSIQDALTTHGLLGT